MICRFFTFSTNCGFFVAATATISSKSCKTSISSQTHPSNMNTKKGKKSSTTSHSKKTRQTEKQREKTPWWILNTIGTIYPNVHLRKPQWIAGDATSSVRFAFASAPGLCGERSLPIAWSTRTKTSWVVCMYQVWWNIVWYCWDTSWTLMMYIMILIFPITISYQISSQYSQIWRRDCNLPKKCWFMHHSSSKSCESRGSDVWKTHQPPSN